MNTDVTPAPAESQPTEQPITGPTSYQLMILGALQHKPMYMGTVPADVIEKRRAKNRAARKSRQANRKSR